MKYINKTDTHYFPTNYFFVLVLLSIANALLMADPMPLPEIQAGPKAKNAPIIDGNLEDEAWKQATILGPFVEHMGRQTEITAPTTARILWDDQFLYVGFDCTEPNPENVIGTITERDGNIFQEDCVEILINARPNQRDYVYYHFAVSAAGTLYDARGTSQGIDKSWNGEWKAAVKKNSHGWQAEMAIPLATLNLSDCSYWKINLCREKPKPQEYSCWSASYGPFHTLNRFGILKGVQSSCYGKQFFPSFTLSELQLGYNHIVIPVCNTEKQNQNVNLVIEEQVAQRVPLRTQSSFTLKGGTTNQLEIPWKISLPGMHQFAITLQNNQGLVLAKEFVSGEFAPLRITPVARSVWVGQSLRTFVKLSVADDQLPDTSFSITITRYPDGVTMGKAQQVHPKSNQSWILTTPPELAPDQYQMNVILYVKDKELDRRSYLFDTTASF